MITIDFAFCSKSFFGVIELFTKKVEVNQQFEKVIDNVVSKQLKTDCFLKYRQSTKWAVNDIEEW